MAGFYRDRFAIRTWKSLLPDGAPWLGGFAKKKLRGRNRAYLAQFLLETRRAEVAHWCMLACLPVFFRLESPVGVLDDDRLRYRRQPALHSGAALQPPGLRACRSHSMPGSGPSMSPPAEKPDPAPRRRRYVVYLFCARERNVTAPAATSPASSPGPLA